MTTKRIRCICGRVYDPVKRPACPDCGAPHVVAKPASEPSNETSAVSKTPSTETAVPSRTPISISPRLIAIGAGAFFLLVIVIALSRCGGKDKSAAAEHDAAKVQPSASPAAPAASPSPSAPVAVTNPSPAGPAAILGKTPRDGEKPSPSPTPEENDLAAMVAKAAPGATIKVPPGIYPNLVVTRPVRLVGDPKMQVFIRGDGKESLSVRSRGVFVQNVQFLSSGAGEHPSISMAENAELELQNCTVQSGTPVGLYVTGKASLKATQAIFVVPNGTGLRLTQQAKANLTQCSFPNTKTGVNALSGATAELRSCAFQGNGGNNGLGSILALNGKGTAVTADGCNFTGNHAGMIASQNASLSISNSLFKDNDATAPNGIAGLISVRESARAVLTGDTFQANRHGVAVAAGGILEVDKCRFTGNGVQQSLQVVLSSVPISVAGQGSSAVVRNSTLQDSTQFAISVTGAGTLTLEDTEISGSRHTGLALGDRSGVPARAEIKRSRFHHNGTGIGTFAGSSLAIEDSECRENEDGIVVSDRGSRVQMKKTKILGNRDHGLLVYGNAEATAVESEFRGNTRGAQSGIPGREEQQTRLKLENCLFGGNRIFATGAYAKANLIVARCSFDGTNKLNIYQDGGASVQTDLPLEAWPTATPAAPMPLLLRGGSKEANRIASYNFSTFGGAPIR